MVLKASEACQNIQNTYSKAHTSNYAGLLFFLAVQSEELHFTDTTSANDFCLVHLYPLIHTGQTTFPIQMVQALRYFAWCLMWSLINVAMKK